MMRFRHDCVKINGKNIETAIGMIEVVSLAGLISRTFTSTRMQGLDDLYEPGRRVAFWVRHRYGHQPKEHLQRKGAKFKNNLRVYALTAINTAV